MAMQSMREFSRDLGRDLGLSADETYGRQRALVESGQVEMERRQGKGGGVAVTSQNVAAVIIAILCADRRSHVEKYAQHYRHMPHYDGEAPGDKAGSTLQDTIADILTDVAVANMIEYISIDRFRYYAEIAFDVDGTSHVARYAYAAPGKPLFGVVAWMHGAIVHQQAIELEEDAKDRSEWTPHV